LGDARVLWAPEVYAPQHGGYCEMSLARGYLSDGKPNLYVIHKAKLYLFYSAANREAFLLARTEALASAEANWQRLKQDLVGPDPGLPQPLVAEVLPTTDAGATSP
ncbi:MAG TPA: hypothetical protein GYA10_16580, partial [Alphaproteobacteria bacterium]|nr:hypothetical protein [Alphaproteobacteria bacterium]